MSIETASLDHPQSDGEQKQILADISLAFEAFKQSNDARLEALEKRQSADVLLTDKVDRINDELGRLSTLAQRPAISAHAPAEDVEAKAQFDAYLRGRQALPDEKKASSNTLALADNDKLAYLVPKHAERRIDEAVNERSALRRLASQTVLESGSSLTYVFTKTKAGATWTDEKDAREATTVPELEKIDIELHELYASPMATQRFIDDSDIDVEDWLLTEIAEVFAETENAAFISGSGNGQPRGLLTYPHTYVDSRSHSEIRQFKSRAKGKFDVETASEVLFETVLHLAGHYRSRAVWLMNAMTQASLRSLKDSSGRYLWTPPTGVGEAPSLYGYPVFDEPHMPAIAPAKVPILFGDFARAYMVIRGQNMSLVRDPYTDKPNVIFYTTRRVGGNVMNASAVRGITIAE